MGNSQLENIPAFSLVCPKCRGKRKAEDEQCPACGVYYFKCEQEQPGSRQQAFQQQEAKPINSGRSFMATLHNRFGDDLYELLFCPAPVSTLGCYIRAYFYLSLFVSGLYWIGFDYRTGELPPYFIGYVLEVFGWFAQGPFTEGSFWHGLSSVFSQLFISLGITIFMLFRKHSPLFASFAFWLFAAAILNQVPLLYQASHGSGFLLHKLGAFLLLIAQAWGGVVVYQQFVMLYRPEWALHPEQEETDEPIIKTQLALNMPDKCPKCGAQNKGKQDRCMQCGLFFMKWAQTQQALSARRLLQKERQPSFISRIWKEVMDAFHPGVLFSPKPNLSRRRLIQQILATCALLYFTTLMIGYDYTKGEMNWFLHTVIFMPLHEGGHAFFMFICPGTFLHSLGGMLGQTLLFLIFGAFFLIKKRDPWLTALFVWLCATGLLDTAPYIYDALDPQLPLLGGKEPGSEGHDWIAMLGQLGAISKAPFIASCVYKIGAGVTLLSLSWMIFLLYKQIGLPLNEIDSLLENTQKSYFEELKQVLRRNKNDV